MKNRTHILLSVVVLVAVSIAIYYPVFDYPFMKGWDDQWQVLNFYTASGISSNSIISIFSEFYEGQYSPLNQFFYAVIFHFFGFNASIFHAVNLLWHIGYVVLIFYFVRILLNTSIAGNLHSNIAVAFGVALLVVLHPINAEVVSWLSASKVSSCAFFYMVALLCYLEYTIKERVLYFVGSLFFFICAFLCKEQAVTLVFSLLLIDWFLHRELRSKNVIIEKLAFFAVALCMLAVTFASYQATVSEVVADSRNYPLSQRIMFLGYSVCEYLEKVILPLNLQYVYPYPMPVGDSIPFRFYLYLLVIPAMGYVVYACRNNRIITFGTLFFLLQLLPFLHIIPLPRSAITADRYLYMAAVGVFFILSYYFYYAIWVKYARWKSFYATVLILFLCFTGYYTQYCSCRWKSEETLKSTVKQILEEWEKLNVSVDISDD